MIGYGGGKRPKDGDKIEVYKQFVIDCYDQGMFRASDAYEPGQDNSASSAPVHVPSASKQSAASATVSHSKPSVATTVDLLNDDHFSSPPPVKSTSIANDFAAFTVPSAPVSSAVHNSFLHDDGSNFSAFQMAPPVSQPDSNVWGDFVQSPSAAPTSQFGAVHTLVPTPAAAHLYSGQPASQPTSYNTSTPIQPTSFPPAQVQGAPVPQSRPTQVAISNVLSMFDAPVASPSSVKTASGNGLNSSHTGLSPMGGMNSASAISGLGAPYGSMPMPMGPQGAYAPMGYGAPQHQVPHPHALNMPLSTPMPMGMNMAPSMGQGGWPGSPVSQPHNNMMMGGYGGHPVPQTNYNQPTMSMSSNGMMKSAVMSIPNTSQMNQGGASSSTDNSFGFVQGMIRK